MGDSMSQFKVSGLKCGGCAGRLTKVIQQVDAGAIVQIDLEGGDVRVDSARLAASEIADLITGAGFGVSAAVL